MINLTISAPPKELSSFVRKIFLIESRGKTKHLQKSVSNPYVHLSFIPNRPPIPTVDNKIVPIVNKLYFIGPIVNANVILEYSNKVTQFAFEFTNTGFYSLFHLSPSEFVDYILPLNNIISSDNCNLLECELDAEKKLTQQKKIIEEFLIEKSKNSLPVCDYVKDTLAIINKHNGYIPVKSIVEQVNISERQLRRKFKEIVGLSPKIYCEILNTHHIITCMQSKDYKSIQDLAHSSDFYDLSHFCHRFKKIMGFKPTEFLNSEIVGFSKNMYIVN